MTVTRVVPPNSGLVMEEVKIVSWLKADGERVNEGELILEVETDKAVLEAEAPASGFLRIVVPTDHTVPAGQVIAYITTEQSEPLPTSEISISQESPRPEPDSPPEASTRPTPAARRRAQELGIDIRAVRATGPDGQVTLQDVDRTALNATERRQQFSPMRRTIAERMTVSARDIPQFSISRDIDMTRANDVRRSAHVSVTDIIMAACARALERHATMRSRVEQGAIVTTDAVHIGVAVASRDGLLVPVIRDANRKSLKELADTREVLETACRNGKLPADAVSGSVLTISNLGPYGVDTFTALVNPPEAAILAVGRVTDRVVARDGQPTVRPVVTLTLSVDHRIADGLSAAKFLDEIAAHLENQT